MTPPPLLIKRSDFLDNASSLLKENKFLCILSELGNGKSVFMKELSFKLHLDGYEVYVLNMNNDNYISDIDKFARTNRHIVLIIDSYGWCKDIVEYLIKINPSNIKVIFSERTMNHHAIVSDFNGEFITKDINIDELKSSEIEKLIKILDHLSLWGNKNSGLNDKQKFNLIKWKYDSQISMVLINLLKSDNINSKIKSLLSSLFEHKGMKKNIFVTCLLDSMGVPDIHMSISLISDLSKNQELYNQIYKLKDLRYFISIDSRNKIKSKSSVFSHYLIKEQFDSNYVIDNCIFILSDLETRNGKTHNLDALRNSIRIFLLRYNFIEKILPDNDSKSTMLVKYFEEIKNKLPHIKNHPHYWLHYAMAQMAIYDYIKAGRYIEAAYSYANQFPEYDKRKIDNQNARLKLLIACSQDVTETEEAMKLFLDADSILSNQPNDIYKFKIVIDYFYFYKKWRDHLEQKQLQVIKKSAKNRFNDLSSFETSDKKNNFKTEKIFEQCRKILNDIINEIKDI